MSNDFSGILGFHGKIMEGPQFAVVRLLSERMQESDKFCVPCAEVLLFKSAPNFHT